ncbi:MULTISPECIES: MFS transporter [unclassified Curtobacterium]|uniref:MFS transporter n=1 Tax=unclassified Curtobacterium TaxID=257496 RepID=UPI001AE11F76|nr:MULTISPECIES: MFS transporter [unclassified Curtobacterium]MBP1302131.1 MHS family proline/betaine transporter-like MFS transporter [Curtobacterium sp. 1310]MCM3504267.1 MFS transporter [Curtobacterium sp. ODYSSEY 48 V2]MCM3520357.1 MFS transporter [Curtobacterium sp. P97]
MGSDPSSTSTRPPRRLRVSDVTVVDRSMMRRAVSGMVVGNTMEWYDVGVYGYLAVTMGRVFLPTAEPSVQILFSLGVFAATYVARPLGGIVFGRLGDRLGRQKVLATTLILMASSTFLIGVLPAWSTIGAVAPVVLVVLKLAQGFSTGGEYAGATTFVTEYAPDRRRGFFASILDFGSYMGFALGATVVTVLQVTLGEETMTAWGWRLPFLLAGVIGVVAIWFRLRIEESPVFQATQAAQEAAASDREAAAGGRPANVLVMVRDHWRPIVIAIMLVGASNTVGYALTSYMPTYLTDSLGYSAIDGTLLTIPVLVLLAVMLPVAGRLSDRIGRRTVMWIGAGTTVVLAVPAFLLIGHGAQWSTLAGLGLLALMTALWVSNQAASLPALFPTSTRYGGMGFAYNIAIAVFGGTTPLIVQALLTATGDQLAPAYFLVAMSVVGAVGVFCMRESSQRPLPGSMPAVESEDEARELVLTQDTNPNLDLGDLPFAAQDRAEAAAER